MAAYRPLAAHRRVSTLYALAKAGQSAQGVGGVENDRPTASSLQSG
jgi:hypothetical protein